MGCYVEVSATDWSLVQRTPAEWRMSECDCAAATMRRPWPTMGCRAGCTIPGARSPWRMKVIRWHLILVGPQYRSIELAYVTLLAPWILRWLLDFWKICASCYNNSYIFMKNTTNTTKRRYNNFKSCEHEDNMRWYQNKMSPSNNNNNNFNLINTLA